MTYSVRHPDCSLVIYSIKFFNRILMIVNISLLFSFYSNLLLLVTRIWLVWNNRPNFISFLFFLFPFFLPGMQNFFRRAGLSMKKSIVCAEESICLDANSPRKLFKYVHEVSGFSLMNLGTSCQESVEFTSFNFVPIIINLRTISEECHYDSVEKMIDFFFILFDWQNKTQFILFYYEWRYG